MSEDLTQFVEAFRNGLARVEFSFGSDPRRYGVMLRGVGPQFLQQLETFVRDIGWGDHWLGRINYVARMLAPEAFLLKVDWNDGSAEALKLYFYQCPPGALLARLPVALSQLGGNAWGGPAPMALARAVGEEPYGIGVRGEPGGRVKAAVYFRPRSSMKVFLNHVLVPLVEACDLPDDLPRSIAADLANLYADVAAGSLGDMLGVYRDDRTGAMGLEFYPAEVVLKRAFPYLEAKGVPRTRLAELERYADNVRRDKFDYLSAEYGPDGFLDWKAYLQAQPRNLPADSRLRSMLPASGTGMW
jgi:hypothetical protein